MPEPRSSGSSVRATRCSFGFRRCETVPRAVDSQLAHIPHLDECAKPSRTGAGSSRRWRNYTVAVALVGSQSLAHVEGICFPLDLPAGNGTAGPFAADALLHPSLQPLVKDE